MSSAACYVDEGARRVVILSPSCLHPGGWRLTWWDSIGPQSHSEHAGRAAALAELSDQIGPWPAVPDFGLEARPSRYRLAEREPSWLGLAVISGGALDPLGAPLKRSDFAAAA